MTIVFGDFGATNARLAVMKRGRMSEIYRFKCDDFKNPYLLLQSFIASYASDATALLAGVPAAVMKGEAKWTNKDWCLSEKKLKRLLKLKEVRLLNDMEVQGYAVQALQKKDLCFLQGKKMESGVQVLMNVGTGLGACLIANGEVLPMEYGNTLVNGEPLEYSVSGRAFHRIYERLSEGENLSSAEDLVMRFQKKDKIAEETYRLFYAELARALMNLALTTKATGGIYLHGNILDEKTLKSFKVSTQFCAHPKMKALLKSMPLAFVRPKDFAFSGFKALAKKYGLS